MANEQLVVVVRRGDMDMVLGLFVHANEDGTIEVAMGSGARTQILTMNPWWTGPTAKHGGTIVYTTPDASGKPFVISPPTLRFGECFTAGKLHEVPDLYTVKIDGEQATITPKCWRPDLALPDTYPYPSDSVTAYPVMLGFQTVEGFGRCHLELRPYP